MQVLREDLALGQNPPDVAHSGNLDSLHRPASRWACVGLPAGQAAHRFESSGLFGLHGQRDSALSGFLRSLWDSLRRPHRVSGLFHVSSDLGDQFLFRFERAFVP